MNDVLLETPSDSHKYLRLAEYFRERIHSGALKPGERLPSFSRMQAEHGIGQSTLEKTYSLLEEERIIQREPKRGTFVAQLGSRRALGVVGVAGGEPPKECPYHRHLLEGIQDVAFQEKIEILLLHDLSSIELGKMDGFITTGHGIRSPSAIPAVNLVMPNDWIPSVTADDFGGAKAATEHLISLGHRRIAFLITGGSKTTDPINQQRLLGFRSALHEAGIEAERDWIRSLHDYGDEMKSFSDIGYRKMNQWLQEDWSRLGCTAILAHNDNAAIGVLRAFEEAGIAVPEQVSVIGFDGTEIADHLHPRLTTVAVPLYEIGASGMRLLLQLISKPTKPSKTTEKPLLRVLPTHLKVQDSTARARR